MSELPRLGKLPPDIFDSIIYPNLGAYDSKVIVKPKHGVDFGVIELNEKRS